MRRILSVVFVTAFAAGWWTSGGALAGPSARRSQRGPAPTSGGRHADKSRARRRGVTLRGTAALREAVRDLSRRLRHGDGKGGVALNPKPSDLTDRFWKHGSSESEIFTLIRDGAKQTAMRGFGGKREHTRTMEHRQLPAQSRSEAHPVSLKIVVADDLPESALELLRAEPGWRIDARSGRPPAELAKRPPGRGRAAGAERHEGHQGSDRRRAAPAYRRPRRHRGRQHRHGRRQRPRHSRRQCTRAPTASASPNRRSR